VGIAATNPRGPLRLVHSSPVRVHEPSWFCGKCAAPTRDGQAPAPNARVCPQCGLGLLLETRSDARPLPSDAFIVVDATLSVQAVSERAEQLLEVNEAAVVPRPVKYLLEPAGAEESDGQEFIRAIIDAATGSDELEHVYVRPLNTFGVRLRARVGPCGPPRAALIVLEMQRPPLQLA
jgi:ribosomal protein S27AE